MDEGRAEARQRRRDAVPYYFIAPGMATDRGRPDHQRAFTEPGQTEFRRWPDGTDRQLMVAQAELLGDEFFVWRYMTFFCGAFESNTIQFVDADDLLARSQELAQQGEFEQSLRLAQRSIWCASDLWHHDRMLAHQCVCFNLLSLGRQDEAKARCRELPVPKAVDERVAYWCMQAWVHATLGMEEATREALTQALRDHDQVVAATPAEEAAPGDLRESIRSEGAFAPFVQHDWFVRLTCGDRGPGRRWWMFWRKH